MAKIYFVDVTNRDGVQTSRLGLAKLQKTIINLMLDDMGITQSEFGFPTTMHELNYLNANLELVKRGVIRRTKLSGWMRAIADDVEKSFTNCPLLENCNLSQSTSDQMIQGKYLGKKNRDDILRMTCEAVEYAVSKGAKIIGVNAEDASRSDLDFLIKLAKEAKKCGAYRFRYCDTLGYEDPQIHIRLGSNLKVFLNKQPFFKDGLICLRDETAADPVLRHKLQLNQYELIECLLKLLRDLNLCQCDKQGSSLNEDDLNLKLRPILAVRHLILKLSGN